MYSTITAKVVDQTLTITNVPKLASGGENEIRVEASFDSYWSGLGKTAIFYRKENQVYKVLMVNDVCVIPREVMATAGTLYFGIIGANGSSVRTTEVVALKVEQGAITGGVTEPLPDVYKQVLAAYASAEAEIATERARLDNLIANGGTSDDAELVDVRLDVDGETHDTAGASVRQQMNDMRLWSARQVEELVSQIGTPSVNLFDYKNASITEKGKLYSHSSADINTPVSVTNTSAYGAIFKARPNVTYTVTQAFNYIVWFDANGVKIGYLNKQINAGIEATTFTTPAGCWYVGLAFRDDYIAPDEIMVVEGETLPDAYTPYACVLRDDVQIGGVVSLSPGGAIQSAIDSGAKIIYLRPGKYGAQRVNISDVNEIKICVENLYDGKRGAKPNVVIDNSVVLNVAASSGLAVTDATFDTTSNWYKVFVSKELEPVRTGLRSTSYNAILWQVDPADNSNDVKLVPVLSLESCSEKAGSFYYDHAAQKVYIHPTASNFSGLEFRRLVIEEGSLLNIENVKSLYMENIEVRYAPEPVYIFKTNECNVVSCKATHTAYGSAFNISATNGNFRNCEAYKACADGFGVGGNGVGVGHMCFYDCTAHHCYDDGISHHNGSTGAVYGGEWHHNTKGGVAPAHGSVVAMHNVISHDNGYGFYVESDNAEESALGRKISMVGCVAHDNAYGISVKNYKCTTYGCDFTNNTVPETVAETEHTSLTKL